MNGELKYLVGLSGWAGLGIKRLKLLLQHFGSLEKIWAAGPDLDSRWQNNKDLDEAIDKLKRHQIKSITIEDKRYPKLLKETDFTPFILYVKGDISLLNQPGITVVGTRKMTDYGRRATSRLVSQLVKKLTIISAILAGPRKI